MIGLEQLGQRRRAGRADGCFGRRPALASRGMILLVEERAAQRRKAK